MWFVALLLYVVVHVCSRCLCFVVHCLLFLVCSCSLCVDVCCCLLLFVCCLLVVAYSPFFPCLLFVFVVVGCLVIVAVCGLSLLLFAVHCFRWLVVCCYCVWLVVVRRC